MEKVEQEPDRQEPGRQELVEQKPIEQIELPLWEVLQAATINPEHANLSQLLSILDATLLQLDTIGQLHVAAEAMAQIVQVFQARSLLAFEELEATTSEAGPVMPTDAFDRYVRQTMEVDFEQFIEALDRLPRQASTRKPSLEDGSSVVGELNQAALLHALDEHINQNPDLTEAEIFNSAMAIAHNEDVSGWISHIADWLHDQPTSAISLVQLQQAIGMPLIQLWLALLLGGYPLEQRGDFYDTQQIWVHRKSATVN